MNPVETGAAAYREQVLSCLDWLPPFSPILNRLLASMAQEDVSFAQLADLIEKDTVLTANVLRLVNSALYGFQGTVNSVRHAVAILGLGKLRNVGMSMSISRMWTQVRTPPGWSGVRFTVHSVATGIFADLLAQRADVPYPEGGFVAGLLHDFGKLLIAISMPREYVLVRQTFELGDCPLTACEIEVMGTTHAELSGLALERWNLPQPIQQAVTFHHAPDLADGGRPHLSHVVHAADQLANELGHSIAPGRVEPTHAREALSALGVAEPLPRLLEQFEPEFKSLQAFF